MVSTSLLEVPVPVLSLETESDVIFLESPEQNFTTGQDSFLWHF